MRKIIKLMNNWTFTDKNNNQSKVTLPHTWNALDGQDGGNDYYRGTCLYETVIEKPDFDVKKELVYIQFHGVNASADVMIDGENVCHHDGGYSTFRKDITQNLLKANNEIKLEVKVDNSVNDRVYPQKADFTFYGGIYRDVELLIVSKDHFDLDYYGGPGIKYETNVIKLYDIDEEFKESNNKEEPKDNKIENTVASKYAKVQIKVTAYTKSTKQVVIGLYDSKGKLIEEKNGCIVTFNLDKARLWDGINDPYMYKVKASIKKSTTVLDEIECNVGVRTFEFSPKDGFYLNGRSYPLYGVSRHQDYKGLGNAITKEHHDNDMAIIKEVGANTIRLAHYQHDQYFYDLCDKEGMIVWAEIPYISEHLTNGDMNTVTQMIELIAQNYNHPSIVTWGVSNEITISGRKLRRNMLENHRMLNELCHKLDETRPTTLACYAVCHPFHPVSKITDLVGWNLYLGWYVPFFWLNDLWISFYHMVYPKRCLCYSEYGAEGMPNLHSKKHKRGDNSEEYQLKYHEYMLECFKRHPYMWATYYWNMFDFAADARNQGGEPGMNHKGMVTFDRKLNKDVFYLYKAYWNKEDKFVYIASKRYEYRSAKKQIITVYSNLDEVSLYHNGKLVETKKGDKVYKFEIELEDNENTIEVKSGDYMDKCTVYKVDEEKKEYYLTKGDSSNWM